LQPDLPFWTILEAVEMADKVFVVAAYVASDDPLLRIKAFIPLTTEHRTLDEAVAAARQDYLHSEGKEVDVTFVVYRSDSGDAIVEVNRNEPFKTAGFYKIALVEAGE
jgi:hypothetical protein